MKLKTIALGLILTGTTYADDVYIYSWETSQDGRTDAIQKMYSSPRGMVMEDTDSGRNGSEVVILSEGIMIMNDANERSSMVLDPNNVPSIGDLLSGGGDGSGAGNGASSAITNADIAAAMEAASQQYQQALQDMTPEEREMMNDLINGGGQLQQQLQEAYAQALAEATPEERQAMQDFFGQDQDTASDEDGILNDLGSLFGGGAAAGQSSNSANTPANSSGIGSRIGGLFGGGRRDNSQSQQSTAQAAEDASASVSSALNSLGGLFGGRNKELGTDESAVAATTAVATTDVVDKDSNLFAGLGNLLGGQSSPPQFTETGNSGRDNGMRWEEVRMTLGGNTSTYHMVNVRDIDGGEQLIRHYETMSNIFDRMMSNMGLGGLMQGIGIWPQEISDYMSANQKFPIYIEQGRTISRLVDVERGSIDDSRFGAQYPVQALF